MNSGNMTARHLEWVGRRDRRVVRAAAADARGVLGDVVLRRPVGARGIQAAHAGAAGRPRAVPRHPTAARRAHAERDRARTEDQESAAVRPHAAPHRAAEPPDQARVAGRSRVQAIRATRRAHRGGRHGRCDRRLLEDLRLPEGGGARPDPSHGAGKEFRRDHGARGVRPHAQRARPPDRDGRGAGSRPTRRRAAPGRSRMSARPAFA